MSLETIPDFWRTKVCAILKSGDPRRIEYTHSGLQRLQDDFPAADEYELEEAMRTALLLVTCTGCPVEMTKPVGVTWEFFFPFNGGKQYGKILLRPDCERIVIFSAHKSEKPRLRCER